MRAPTSALSPPSTGCCAPRARPASAAVGLPTPRRSNPNCSPTPSPVWTWDITKLRGPDQGRLVPPLRHHRHLLPLQPGMATVGDPKAVRTAEEFIDDRDKPRNGARPTHRPRRPRHVDDVGIGRRSCCTTSASTRSHSRPRTSNDNPFSEAQFKTMKYVHDFPKAVYLPWRCPYTFCDGFFNEYNHVHRHSGIGLHTAVVVHFGTADTIDEARAPSPSPPPTTPTRPASAASRQPRRNCQAPHGSIRPRKKPPLSKSKSAAPHTG